MAYASGSSMGTNTLPGSGGAVLANWSVVKQGKWLPPASSKRESIEFCTKNEAPFILLWHIFFQKPMCAIKGTVLFIVLNFSINRTVPFIVHTTDESYREGTETMSLS